MLFFYIFVFSFCTGIVRKPNQVIDSSPTSIARYISELLAYKDLLLTLALRDFKVRYSQTFLGFLWVFVQPVSTMLVLVFIFDKALHVDTHGTPYPLFAMAGMMLWTYFGYVVNQSGNSIISSQSIISKVYFPRLVIPISKAFVGLIDFLVSFLIFVSMMVWYQQILSPQLGYAFLFTAIAFLFSVGFGILVCALTVRFRDFQHVIPFVLQFGLYITPIAYPTSLIPSNWKLLYFVNPMAGIVEAFRWSVFGSTKFEPLCYVSFVSASVFFVLGFVFFIKTESEMADLV